jgi:hypothetical protein
MYPSNCNQRCVITHKYNVLVLRVMKSNNQKLPGFSGDIVLSKANNSFYQADLNYSYSKNSADRNGVLTARVVPEVIIYDPTVNEVCGASLRCCHGTDSESDAHAYCCGMASRWC